MALTAAVFILLLTFSALPSQVGHVARNVQNIRLLRSLCTVEADCNQAILGSLPARSMPAGWTDSADLTPCQALWASRLLANDDPAAAQQMLARAVECPRQQLVAMWAGSLAWAQGRRTEATAQWRTLPPSQLINWSYSLTLDGNTDWALHLLQLVAGEYGPDLSLDERRELYAKIGHAYRTDARWPEAREAYQQAWQLAPDDPELAFFYGMSAREAGRPAEAAPVLEHGLPFLPSDRAYFIVDYYIQLGLAYAESGKQSAAIEAFHNALTWAQRQEPPAPQKEQFIQDLIQGQSVALP